MINERAQPGGGGGGGGSGRAAQTSPGETLHAAAWTASRRARCSASSRFCRSFAVGGGKRLNLKVLFLLCLHPGASEGEGTEAMFGVQAQLPEAPVHGLFVPSREA